MHGGSLAACAAANPPLPEGRRDLHPRLRQLVEHELFGLRGLTLARLGWTIALAAGLTAYSTVGNLMLAPGEGPNTGGPVAPLLAYWFPLYLTAFIPQALVWTLVDSLPLRGALRLGALALGGAFATATLPLLLCATLHSGDAACQQAFPPWTAFREFAGYMVPTWYLATLIAIVCLVRRRDRALAAALHASRLAGIDGRRQLLDAELQATQARVEPEFLFDALRAVADLYDRDPHHADRLLDHLIGYLRAALPDMRSAGTTVGREVELLRSYLAILALRPDRELATHINVEPDIAAVRMPPMLLVPLAAPAGSHAIDPPGRSGPVHVDVDVRAVGSRIRIAIAASGPAADAIARSPAVDEARARLAAFYGTRAALSVDRSGALPRVIVEIPNEHADRGTR